MHGVWEFCTIPVILDGNLGLGAFLPSFSKDVAHGHLFGGGGGGIWEFGAHTHKHTHRFLGA